MRFILVLFVCLLSQPALAGVGISGVNVVYKDGKDQAKAAMVSGVHANYSATMEFPMAYSHEGVALEGTLFKKNVLQKDGKTADQTPKPGILLMPEWWGNNDYAKMRARQLAAQGYVVMVADMYGTGKVTEDPKVATEWSNPFYEDRNLMRSRARAALQVLKSQPNVDKNNTIIIGFCFGGTVALELARHGEDVKGVATFHGGLQFTDVPEKGAVKAHVLVMNGGADPMVPAKDKDKFLSEMEAAGADYQFIDYSGALHAFTNPAADKFHAALPAVGYNAVAERRSFTALDGFLKEVLGK